MGFTFSVPQHNPAIGDQLAQALVGAIAMRHDNERRAFEKQKMQHDLATMKHEDNQKKIDEARTAFENTKKDAFDAIRALTGQDAPVGDISNGVSGIQGLPESPNTLEAMLANTQVDPSGGSAAMNPMTRPDMSSAVPLGQNPLIQFPVAPGRTVGIRPDTRQQQLEEAVVKQSMMDQEAARRAGMVTTANRQAQAANPVQTAAERTTPMTKEKAEALHLSPALIGQNLTPAQEKLAVSAAYNQEMLKLRGDSIKDREKARLAAANRPGALHMISTVNEDGIPVTQMVRENKQTGEIEVVHSFPKPLGEMERRLVDTNVAIVNTADKIFEDLKDPAVRALIGPVSTRATSLKDFIGLLPPEGGELKGDLHALSLAIPGAHTLRSIQAAKYVEEFLSKPGSPELLEEKLKGLLTFPLNYIEAAGKGAGGLKRNQKTTTTPAETRKQVNGKWYIINGDTATLDPNQK